MSARLAISDHGAATGRRTTRVTAFLDAPGYGSPTPRDWSSVRARRRLSRLGDAVNRSRGRAAAEALDRTDPLAGFRDEF